MIDAECSKVWSFIHSTHSHGISRICQTLFQAQGIQWYEKASSCLAESLIWRVDKKLMKEMQETDTKQINKEVDRSGGRRALRRKEVR